MQREVAGLVLAVKVSSPMVGGEDVVVGQERWEELRRLKACGMTVSWISRATGLDRKTVRRCLRQVRWQAYRRAARRERLLAPHREWLKARAPEVGYSARILYQELIAQRGLSRLRNGARRGAAVAVETGRLTSRSAVRGPSRESKAVDWARRAWWWGSEKCTSW